MFIYVPMSHADFAIVRAEVESDPEFIAWMAEDFEPEPEQFTEADRWAEWGDHHYQ